jgi:hypothetical protein
MGVDLMKNCCSISYFLIIFVLAILIWKLVGSFSCEKCKNLSKQKINKDEAKNSPTNQAII